MHELADPECYGECSMAANSSGVETPQRPHGPTTPGVSTATTAKGSKHNKPNVTWPALSIERLHVPHSPFSNFNTPKVQVQVCIGIFPLASFDPNLFFLFALMVRVIGEAVDFRFLF